MQLAQLSMAQYQRLTLLLLFPVYVHEGEVKSPWIIFLSTTVFANAPFMEQESAATRVHL